MFPSPTSMVEASIIFNVKKRSFDSNQISDNREADDFKHKECERHRIHQDPIELMCSVIQHPKHNHSSQRCLFSDYAIPRREPLTPKHQGERTIVGDGHSLKMDTQSVNRISERSNTRVLNAEISANTNRSPGILSLATAPAPD